MVTCFIGCLVCGQRLRLINNTHLKRHGLTPAEYKNLFPGSVLYSDSTRKNNCRARKVYAQTQAARIKTARIGKANKGKKRTSEWCEERSKQYTGVGNPFYDKTHSLETRKKLSIFFQGVSPEAWEGFSNDERKRAWKSKRAVRWSREIFERDDFTCALCGIRGGDLEAHHIITRAESFKLTYVLENGITLCVSCHRKIRGKESHYKERFGKMNIRDKPCKVSKSLL